jgi:2-C-methyl-D-erythritol 4-phosphate cytidylyltransferase
MKKWAIIVAGGSGQRMGSPIPKQFLLLNDRPLLYYTIDAFYAAYSDMQVVLVLPADHLTLGQSLIDSAFADKNILLTTGGATRFDSVKNGLALTPTDAVIFVHDGVRCLVSPQLVKRCYEGALQSGAVVPAITASDSIRLRADSSAATAPEEAPADRTTVLNRDRVLLVQTPQTFLGEWLHQAFTLPYCEAFTDEATVLEQAGRMVTIVAGEETNIKITRPIDLLIAERYLQERG